MKTNLKIKGIEIKGIKIGEIAIEQEYSVTEAINMISCGKALVKEFIKEVPEIINDLDKIDVAVEELYERQDAREAKKTKYNDSKVIINTRKFSKADAETLKAEREIIAKAIRTKFGF